MTKVTGIQVCDGCNCEIDTVDGTSYGMAILHHMFNRGPLLCDDCAGDEDMTSVRTVSIESMFAEE